MPTKPFDAEKLKQLLIEYGSLQRVIEALKAEKASLEAEVQHLTEMKGERDKLEMLLANLKDQKTGLESDLDLLREIRDNLDKASKLLESERNAYQASISQLKTEVAALEEKRFTLEGEIKESKERKDSLIAAIAPLEEDLKLKETLEREMVGHRTALEQIEAKTKMEAQRLEVLDAFLGLLHATDAEDLKGLDRFVPRVLQQVQRGEISVSLFKKYIISQLTGNCMKILECSNCTAEFAVNKPAGRWSLYHCPLCGLSYGVSIKAEVADVLESQL